MRKLNLERLSLNAIRSELNNAGLEAARSKLAFAVGSVIDVSGKVQKCARREGVCRLVIESNDDSGLLTFANFLSDSDNLRKHKIRKGSLVSISGKLQSFGARAVCLSDCRLQLDSLIRVKQKCKV